MNHSLDSHETTLSDHEHLHVNHINYACRKVCAMECSTLVRMPDL